LPLTQDPNLIVGFEKADDAGVYKITDELALIQTVDFFTPIVDDPYVFGQIAAANALSDVYAMGGKPLTAMNVVCFPIKTLDIGVLKAILRGGLDKLIEAETTLVGGHSVENNEIKYGLSVTGIIHPEKVLTNMTAHIGDYLILTKPLGTGIINTAIKGGMAGEETITRVSNTMVTLNKDASIAMQEVGVSACTDITGFGLLGHLSEMVRGNGIGMIVYAGKVPYFSEAKEFAGMGMVPGGTYRNKDFFSQWIRFDSTVPQYLQDILFDPQTSGGLLISVPRGKADGLLTQLRGKNVNEAVIIGEVVAEPKEKIIIT
jgi:selenide,water dikinase